MKNKYAHCYKDYDTTMQRYKGSETNSSTSAYRTGGTAQVNQVAAGNSTFYKLFTSSKMKINLYRFYVHNVAIKWQ